MVRLDAFLKEEKLTIAAYFGFYANQNIKYKMKVEFSFYIWGLNDYIFYM